MFSFDLSPISKNRALRKEDNSCVIDPREQRASNTVGPSKKPAHSCASRKSTTTFKRERIRGLMQPDMATVVVAGDVLNQIFLVKDIHATRMRSGAVKRKRRVQVADSTECQLYVPDSVANSLYMRCARAGSAPFRMLSPWVMRSALLASLSHGARLRVRLAAVERKIGSDR